jgi:tRNA A37 threonylcarbamoyladenosine synthetase subunit TsaC/SUA5/YrdC
VRIPDSPLVRALLAELGEPLQSSTLIMPGETQAMDQGWEVKERLDHLVDAVVDSSLDGLGVGLSPTTVVDLSGDEPEVKRVGAGDVSRFG